MKKFIFLFLFVLINLNANTTTLSDEKAKNAAMTLNYLHGSLNKIVLYNDKIVLEEEYNNIINNLNLTVINDQELVQVITYLMDTLTHFRLSEMDRAKFRAEYEGELEDALTGALSGLANIRGSNPVELGINAVLGIGSAYFNYKNAQKSLKNGLEKSTYSLDKEAITDLNDIRKEFILTYWEIMKRYNMPDKWRVSEKQFTRLINVLKDNDKEKVYRQLLRMENQLSLLPMYWYELSLVARKLNKKDAELEYISKFESLNNRLFRQDSMYSLLLANKVSYMNVKTQKEEIIELLEKIYKVDSLNPNRKLFIAMKYLQLKNYNRADFLLTQNVDDNFLPSISGRLKLDLYLKTDNKDFEHTLSSLLEKQNLSAEEYLYYLAKRPTKLLLKEIAAEVKKIKINLNKSIYGKEDLIVKLPKTWVLRDIEDTELNVVINQKSYKFNKILLENDEFEYLFKDLIDLSKLKKENIITLKFKHKHVPVELVYKMLFEDEQEEKKVEAEKVEVKKETSYLDRIKNEVAKKIDDVKNSNVVQDIKDSEITEYAGSVYDNVKKDVNKLVAVPSTSIYGAVKNVNTFLITKISFEPIKIITEDKCFEIKNNMKECK